MGNDPCSCYSHDGHGDDDNGGRSFHNQCGRNDGGHHWLAAVTAMTTTTTTTAAPPPMGTCVGRSGLFLPDKVDGDDKVEEEGKSARSCCDEGAAKHPGGTRRQRRVGNGDHPLLAGMPKPSEWATTAATNNGIIGDANKQDVHSSVPFNHQLTSCICDDPPPPGAHLSASTVHIPSPPPSMQALVVFQPAQERTTFVIPPQKENTRNVILVPAN
jgi:hypothetical protein